MTLGQKQTLTLLAMGNHMILCLTPGNLDNFFQNEYNIDLQRKIVSFICKILIGVQTLTLEMGVIESVLAS